MKYQDLHIKDPVKLLHLVQGACLFAGIVALTFWITANQQRLEEETLRNAVNQKSLTFKAQLEGEINANIFLVNGLAATIISYPDLPSEKINLALQALFKLGHHIRNIGLAPANRLSHIYPIEGNESAIGIYYPEEVAQWPAVKTAIESEKTILTGPISLVQGGKGLISRTPVFLENGNYWGMLSLMLDYDSLMAATRVLTDESDLEVAIRNMELYAQDPVFFGTPATFDLNPVILPIQLPGNYWELAATPRSGWHTDPLKYSLIQMGGLLLALLAMVIFLTYQRNNLSTLTSLTRLKAILNTTHDGIIVLDAKGRIREFNPAAEKLFGYRVNEVLDQSMNLLLKNDQSRPAYHYSSNPMNQILHGFSDVVGLHKNGTEIFVEITIGEARISDESCYVGVIRDITERKANEAKLQKLAHTDSLTGALNRRAFQEIADKTFATAKRYQRPLSLLSIDVDYFKLVNDTHGHDAGDKVLIELVGTLNVLLRTVDTICRFGGEEFLVLLPETNEDQAIHTAEKIRMALASVIVSVAGKPIQFSVSIGVSPLTSAIHTLPQMITMADTALYEAKGAGRNCTMVHGMAFLFNNARPHDHQPFPRIQLVR